jgi:hypothetical protein
MSTEKIATPSNDVQMRNDYVRRIREAEKLRGCEADHEDTFSIVWEIMVDSFNRGIAAALGGKNEDNT